MAFHTQSQFAELIGKSRGWLNVYIKRGGLNNPIMSGEFIDDTVHQNKEFLLKWKQKLIEANKPATIKGPTSFPEPIQKPLKAPRIEEPKEIELKPSADDSLDTLKKKAEIEYKLGQVKKLKLEQAKLIGENIPIDSVASLIASLSNGFQQSYKSGAESLMMELSNKYKIPVKGIAELKGKLFELINSSHDKGIKLSKKELKNIISDVKFKDDEPF